MKTNLNFPPVKVAGNPKGMLFLREKEEQDACLLQEKNRIF